MIKGLLLILIFHRIPKLKRSGYGLGPLYSHRLVIAWFQITLVGDLAVVKNYRAFNRLSLD